MIARCGLRRRRSSRWRAARRFCHAGVPLPDLVQEGTIGLITAAEKFEPARGWRFSTYASYWIRQSVQRSIQNHARPIRIPSYMNDAGPRTANQPQGFSSH